MKIKFSLVKEKSIFRRISDIVLTIIALWLIALTTGIIPENKPIQSILLDLIIWFLIIDYIGMKHLFDSLRKRVAEQEKGN